MLSCVELMFVSSFKLRKHHWGKTKPCRNYKSAWRVDTKYNRRLLAGYNHRLWAWS